jgi:aminoglycoside 2'-N-acetyltransferase I
LSTGSHAFYERLGWLRWQGKSHVRTTEGSHRTPEDDDGLMVLPTRRVPHPDRTADIECEWRAGDVW